MNHVMFCVSGFAGVGKDEFCKRLVSNHSAFHTGLIDPAKRHVGDVYGFTEDQLFGPSIYRNKGDLRYPKRQFHALRLRPLNLILVKRWEFVQPPNSNMYFSSDFFVTNYSFIGEDNITYYAAEEGDARFWLSPREVLQLHGELFNDFYENTWVKKGVDVHFELASGKYQYSRMSGLIPAEISRPDTVITCFSDFRHSHEIDYVRSLPEKSCLPLLIRIKSERVPAPLFSHRSETEQVRIPDTKFNYVIYNDGSIEDLHSACDKIVQTVLSGGVSRSHFEEIHLSTAPVFCK